MVSGLATWYWIVNLELSAILSFLQLFVYGFGFMRFLLSVSIGVELLPVLFRKLYYSANLGEAFLCGAILYKATYFLHCISSQPLKSQYQQRCQKLLQMAAPELRTC